LQKSPTSYCRRVTINGKISARKLIFGQEARTLERNRKSILRINKRALHPKPRVSVSNKKSTLESKQFGFRNRKTIVDYGEIRKRA
jgi:hypothetical protein